MRRFGFLVVFGVAACASPAPRVAEVKPPPPPVVVVAPRAQTATIVLNLKAFRESARTKRAVDVAKVFLPEGERTDEIEWLAVDGASPLREASKSVVFVKAGGAPLRMVRGSESGAGVPALPTPPRADELFRIQVHAPHAIVRVPHFEPSEAVEELTIVAIARADGGADMRVRERCTDAAEAAKAATALDETIERWNGRGIGIVTGGLFADAKATVDGVEARLDIQASPEQVATIAELAASVLKRPDTR